MKHCPITYGIISDRETYSREGLKKISRTLTHLNIFPYSSEEQRKEARIRATKMSIQGVQPKLSARVSLKNSVFEITDKGGTYVLKPQTADYERLPENEDVSMRLASVKGIEVPFHGLLLSADGSYTYFIKRMDRFGHKGKIPLEDFAQLSGKSRETKYDSSMEKVAGVIEKYCSFPIIEKEKLFVRTIFNFLIGNEDMHLKNFSLIVKDGVVSLAPAYDLLNSTIALEKPHEEIALPLNGKKHRLNQKDLLSYYPLECLKLNHKIIDQTIAKFKEVFSKWQELVEISFLPDLLKEKYSNVISQRREILTL